MISREKLEKYYQDGLLEKQHHPTLPLTIWNYAQDVQYKDLWDEVLIHCRGLVTDDSGKIVAKPFKKFFNIEEGKHHHSSDFTIWEKVDGSLGILFWYADEWHLCTRGSFASEQAIKGKEILSKYPNGWETYLRKDYTYLFEIVYPENKIVIDYGSQEDLILLGAVNLATWEELTPEESMVCNDWFKEAKRYHFDDYKELKALNRGNEEGFVVWFSTGSKCKIKFDSYLRRHKIVWSLTNRLIWDYISQGKIDEFIEDVPDEFYDIIKEEVMMFDWMFRQIKTTYSVFFNEISDNNATRREFAEKAKAYQFPQILFKMLDGKPYDDVIWKILYPTSTEKLLNKNI